MPVFGRRGNALLLSRDPIAQLIRAYQRYGSISALVRDDPSVVFALGPDASEQLLANPEVWQPSIEQNTRPCGRSLDAGLQHETVLRLTQQMLGRWGLGCQLDVLHVMRHVTVQAGSAALLAWTFFLLSQHPRVLSDLQAELDCVLKGAPPTPRELTSLPVLHGVVSEAARLFPPVAIAQCTSRAACDLGPYRLAAGTTVIYSPYIVHRLTELYLSPQRFRPERWLFLEPAPHTYLPFGAFGEMGNDAASIIVESKLVLATVLQRFSLGLAPSTRVDRGPVRPFAPRDGLLMIVAPADRPVIRRRPGGNIGEMVALE